MDGDAFLVDALVNKSIYAEALIDLGCLYYGIVSQAFADRANLQRISITPRRLDGVIDNIRSITEVAYIRLDLDGYI